MLGAVYEASEEFGDPAVGVHRVAALLKRWLAGTMHFAQTDTHLAYYLDEFTFRSTGAPADHAGCCGTG